MKSIQWAAAAAILAIAVLAAPACATQIFSLDFSSAVTGTLQDANGLGIGFPVRLANTGGAIALNDPNLVLDRRLGVLRMTSTNGDVNGQRDLPTICFVGVDLASLGFSGTQDFHLTASFVNVPTDFPAQSNSFDQFGAFVGEDSLFLTRGGGTNYETFGASEFEAFGDNILNGVKVDDAFFGPLTGNTMLIEMSRTGGFWQTSVNGADRTPLVQPNFLDAANLVAGVWLYSTDDSQFVIDLTSFQLTVVPEPTSAMLLGISLCWWSVRRK